MTFYKSLLCLFLLPACLFAEAEVFKDISYKATAVTDYEKERCKLDVYRVTSKAKSPVLLWFHGGSIQQGSKSDEKHVKKVAKHFVKHGVGFVAVNYRLSPKVKYPSYIEDCASSIKWLIEFAEKFKIDPGKIFVGGHSAGGYLTLMSSFENPSVKKVGLDLSNIAGLVPVAGQTVTHSTVRGESHIPKSIIIADEKSPLYSSAMMKLPTFLIAGSNDLPMRAEENQLLYAAIKKNNSNNRLGIYNDRDHGTIVSKLTVKDDPAFKDILEFISNNQIQ